MLTKATAWLFFTLVILLLIWAAFETLMNA